MKKILLILFIGFVSSELFAQTILTLNKKDDGYRGIWYSDQPSNDQYRFKYSGGLGTYPANHYPFSIYVEKVNKTFFCYGATDKDQKTLLHAVSYFDHKTKMVPQPTIVLDKKTDNAHDNPVMNIDQEGYIWIFSTSHGTNAPSYIHKSTKPYDISHFEQIYATKIQDGKSVPLDNFSYLQSWYKAGKGFLNLFTHYDRGVIPGQPKKPRRTISFMYSADGKSYGTWNDLAIIEEGHYQTSGSFEDSIIGTSFNYHPVKVGENGLNYRTNLYYLETRDFGKTWQNAFGEIVDIPLRVINNPALVKDYVSSDKKIYINDLTYDNEGHPIILFVTTNGYQSGPENGSREWYTARFDGSEWIIFPVTSSDNNYDMGSLYIDKKGIWRIIAPTAQGPQAYNTGGEMVLWTSKDQGKSWKDKQLTFNSLYNHSYARRPVHAHPDFYAFWADGHAREKSSSRLYFADHKGRVFMLPTSMKQSFEFPIPVKK
ncbi:BNR repeat-containing family member [Sphingobacterium nematocida]|uniref:BNR repeat-containing family member n=1 Tax=Sphingobacterium nematocida TaxID=1513896 RepID=A0A1T5F582_9SPHI|nr:BNR-4 repeat-containing protein [Sphingobacterium nematocida]SKB91261.1 BNR repeat-containing family member [Sphingobacterium nematocida]